MNENEKTDLVESTIIELPAPWKNSEVSVEEAMSDRRSHRRYSDRPITLAQLGQALWAAQGVTDPRGYRTAPSAGALFPLEIYVVAGNVEGLAAGVYKYIIKDHKLKKVIAGDIRYELSVAALDQVFIDQAPATLVFAAVYERVTSKYGGRGKMYVHMEAGHAAQNVCLQAVGMKMGSVVVGAFHDDNVHGLLKMEKDEKPLYMIPFGWVD